MPAVVVAPDETSPPNTESPPSERDDNRRGPEKVDDAVEKTPLRRPRVVDVLLYPATEVNGNAPAEVTKPASFVH